MELASANRRYAEIHQNEPFHDGTFTTWSEKRTARTPYHFQDGVHIWVADFDVNPEDQFLTTDAEVIPGGNTPRASRP